MKILVSSAEASSDQLLARVLTELIKQVPTAEIRGIGGPACADAGVKIIFPAEKLLAMGTSEVLARLPAILEARRRLVQEAESWKPDVIILVDYADFHFSVLKRLRGLDIPKLYLVPPKVWVWRERRLKVLHELVSEVLCVFPFEVPFFERGGVRARFVGNPLVEILPFDLPKAEARSRLDLPAEGRLLALLPGSRPEELHRHAKLFCDVARRLGMSAVAALPRVLVDQPQVDRALRVFDDFGIPVRRGNTHEVLKAADIGLLKSGTVTLEAGLLGLPHGIAYRASALTEWSFHHVVQYSGPVGLVNLVCSTRSGEPWKSPRADALFPELLANDATVERLAEMLRDVERRQSRQVAQMAELRLLLQSPVLGQHPSETAAQAILEWVEKSVR